MFPIPFWGKFFIATRLFVKINISYFNAFSPFIFKYRPVYMTDATLNANFYFDICSIPSKFHMCMYDRMKNIFAQNQSSIQCSYVWKAVHNRTFWMILVQVVSRESYPNFHMWTAVKNFRPESGVKFFLHEIFHTWNRCEFSIRHVQPCSTCEILNWHTFHTCFWCELGMKQVWSDDNILYGKQLSGFHANEIKHDHAPVVIVVLDPWYEYKAVYI